MSVASKPGNSICRIVTKGTSLTATFKKQIAAACKEKALQSAYSTLNKRWHPPMLRRSGVLSTLREQGLTDADVVKLVDASMYSDMVCYYVCLCACVNAKWACLLFAMK
jgi:hypothetical protein